ncbi:MAG TPA: hypothetical protein QGH10_10995 [Armatimonadota bacterium]|nr:hypothetical protein [Armatimonadota bacterium]
MLAAATITPDIIIRHPGTGGAPDQHRGALQALAAQVRSQLAPLYSSRADSSDSEVIVRRRQFADTEYLFAINDRLTYGGCVGHRGIVMEQGMPYRATVSPDRGGGAVHDLLTSRAVAAMSEAGRLQWPGAPGPGEGRVYVVTPARWRE